jgi:hypothetical protein
MPSTYSNDLRIELIANGEKTGTWGTITNTNLGTIIEDAISGLANVTVVGAPVGGIVSQALTALNGLADQARCAAIVLTSAITSPNTIKVFVPPASKLYVFTNNCTVTVTVVTSDTIDSIVPAVGGTTVAIPAGKSMLLRCDGLNIVEQFNYAGGSFETAGNISTLGNASITGTLTVGSTMTANGNVNLGDAFVDTTTITGLGVINANSASPALKVTQAGAGASLLIEDVASDTTPFIINGDGNVGIGLSTPTNKLELYSATAANLFIKGDSATGYFAQRTSTDTVGPFSYYYKARGTAAAPTAVASGDATGTISFVGYGGTTLSSVAAIQSNVDTYTADNNLSGYLSFFTRTDGLAAPLTERLRVTKDGSLNILNTGARITGDFSNATLANRVMFQNSVTNAPTVVSTLPNGTGNISGFSGFNNSSPLNAGVGSFAAYLTDVRISSSTSGSGTAIPMTFYVGGSERARIDTSGNFGIGGTPSGTYKLEVNGAVAASSFNGSGAGLTGTASSLTVGTATNATTATTANGLNTANSYQVSALGLGAAPAATASSISTGTVNSYFRINNAYLSSGGDFVHLASHAWYNGAAWTGDGTAGGLFQITGQTFNWFKGTASVSPVYTSLMSLDASGNLVATGNVTAFSDIKLKENIEPITDAIYKVGKLNGVTYSRKDIDGYPRQTGLIAQDVQAVLPEAVIDHEGTLSVAYGNMIGLMVEAIKELKAEIEELKKGK